MKTQITSIPFNNLKLGMPVFFESSGYSGKIDALYEAGHSGAYGHYEHNTMLVVWSAPASVKGRMSILNYEICDDVYVLGPVYFPESITNKLRAIASYAFQTSKSKDFDKSTIDVEAVASFDAFARFGKYLHTGAL